MLGWRLRLYYFGEFESAFAENRRIHIKIKGFSNGDDVIRCTGCYFQHGDSESVDEHDDDDENEILKISELVLRESNKANGCKSQANKQSKRKMCTDSKSKNPTKVIFWKVFEKSVITSIG